MEDMLLFGETALGCIFTCLFFYGFLRFMMKVPLASKKIMKWNILIFLPFLGIALLVYGFWYFTGEFTKMAFGVPLILLTDLKLLEKLEEDI